MSPSTTATSKAAATSSRSAFAKYAACLRSHGVEGFGGPGSAGSTTASTVAPATLKAAQQACASLRPAGFAAHPSGASAG